MRKQKKKKKEKKKKKDKNIEYNKKDIKAYINKILEAKNYLIEKQQENLIIKDSISYLKEKLDIKEDFLSFDLDEDWANKEIKTLNDDELQSLNIRFRNKKKKKYP